MVAVVVAGTNRELLSYTDDKVSATYIVIANISDFSIRRDSVVVLNTTAGEIKLQMKTANAAAALITLLLGIF